MQTLALWDWGISEIVYPVVPSSPEQERLYTFASQLPSLFRLNLHIWMCVSNCSLCYIIYYILYINVRRKLFLLRGFFLLPTLNPLQTDVIQGMILFSRQQLLVWCCKVKQKPSCTLKASQIYSNIGFCKLILASSDGYKIKICITL